MKRETSKVVAARDDAAGRGVACRMPFRNRARTERGGGADESPVPLSPVTTPAGRGWGSSVGSRRREPLRTTITVPNTFPATTGSDAWRREGAILWDDQVDRVA